jgi:hypothetical protein
MHRTRAKLLKRCPGKENPAVAEHESKFVGAPDKKRLEALLQAKTEYWATFDEKDEGQT